MRKRAARAVLACMLVSSVGLIFCMFELRRISDSNGGSLQETLLFAGKPNTFEDVEEDMLERKERIRRTCQIWRNLRFDKMGPSHPFVTWARVDVEHKLAFCVNPKAGTSTVLKHLLTINSEVSEEDRQNWLTKPNALHTRFAARYLNTYKAHNNVSTLDQFKSYLNDTGATSFSFVRHPFERLASAFEDKILLKFNKTSALGNLSRSLGADFSNFIDHILKEGEGCRPFQPCSMNAHWKPYYARCDYCNVEYDVIGQLETFSRDIQHVYRLSGLMQAFPPGTLATTRMNARPHASDRAVRYLSTLDGDRLDRLHAFYRYDFDLFGYEAQEYLELAAAARNKA